MLFFSSQFTKPLLTCLRLLVYPSHYSKTPWKSDLCLPSPVLLLPFSLELLPTRLSLSASTPAALVKVTNCQLQSPFSGFLLPDLSSLSTWTQLSAPFLLEYFLILASWHHPLVGHLPPPQAAPSHGPSRIPPSAQYLNIEVPKLSACT